MKYYGLLKNGELIEANIIPIKANGFETKEITQNEYETFKTKQNLQIEQQNKLNELTNWFDNYFDKQLKQSQWQDDFTVSKDTYFKDESGQPKTYANIDELKAQAKLTREEIKRLRQN